MKLNFFILKYRLWLVIIPILISILMLLPLRYARINPDLMDYLPEDIEAKVNMDKINNIFGEYDPVILFFESDDILSASTLERLYNLNKRFKRIREFDDVISLFESKNIRGEQGMMLVDPVVKKIPETETEKENLRLEIINNEMVYQLLVSEDFKYSIMLLNPAEDMQDAETFKLISDVLKEFPGDEKVYFNGLPFLRDEIQKKATRDLAVLFPLGLIVMIVFLYLSFRQIRSVLLPFAVVLMSIILAMGMMPLLGYELSLIAVLIPIMMIAIANNYVVHIVARYQELNAKYPEWSMKQITMKTLSLLNIPIILTALTTIVGILGLSVHIMLPARQMGIVTAVGIAYAVILSLFFIPALMSYMSKGKPQKSIYGGNGSPVDKFLKYAAKATVKLPRLIIIIFSALVFVAALGISNLKLSINLEKMLPASNQMRISTNIANEHFGGTKSLSVLFEGDILEPEVMQEIDFFEKELSTQPNVGNVTSIAKVIKIISRALNDPADEYYGVIPNDRSAIAQYIEFYNMSGNPDDLEKLIDFNYSKAILNVQFKAESMEDFNKLISKLNSMIEKSPYASMMAGQPLLEKEMAESILKGQVYSLIFALFAIALLLWIIFRSFRAGLMGSLPLLICLVCNFGLMGWMGIKLDIATSLLSTIAIGIGVDYTIHLFWRLKQEIINGSSYSEAVKISLASTGRGIAINAFSVIIGFAVLFFSGLIILKTFAFLIIFSILLCLLGALILMPAIIILVKPKFLKL